MDLFITTPRSRTSLEYQGAGTWNGLKLDTFCEVLADILSLIIDIMVTKLNREAARRQRLFQRAIALLPISLSSVARQLQVTPASLSRYQRGTREVPPKILAAVATMVRRHRLDVDQLERDLGDRPDGVRVRGPSSEFALRPMK